MEVKSLIYQFDDVRVVLERFEVVKADSRVRLEPKAFEALVFLIEHRGQLVGKKELLDAVWKEAFVTENDMTRVIAQLRKVLGDDSRQAKYIETVPTRGYRFIAEVQVTKRQEVGELDFNQDKKTHRRFVIIAASAMLVLSVIVLAYFWVSNRPRNLSSRTPIRSIAVLPFKPLDVDNSDQSLELGMADTLITKLSTIKQIIVRPTSSVIKYAGAGQDPLGAGRELRVDSVLDGHTQRSGDKIRLTVQLVSVPDGAPLWSEKFDAKYTDTFTVEDLISEKVVEALRLKLTTQEQRRLAKHFTENAEAHRLYLVGRYHLYRRTAERFQKSIEYFQRAIELDRNYAPAYAALSYSYISLGIFGALPPKDATEKAKEAVTRALEIDDELAEAHTTLAAIKERCDWDWSGAETEHKLAIELDPSSAEAHDRYGVYLMFLGHFNEALAETKQAQELDPLSVVISRDVGLVLYFARRYDEAIEQCRKTLELDPNFPTVYNWSGGAYEQQRMYGQAIGEYLKRETASGSSQERVAAMTNEYAASGWKGYWLKRLGEAKEKAKQQYFPPDEIAAIYARLGENDQALKWLRKAYEERSFGLIDLKTNPMWDGLRSDPRFADLLRRSGLPR